MAQHRTFVDPHPHWSILFTCCVTSLENLRVFLMSCFPLTHNSSWDGQYNVTSQKTLFCYFLDLLCIHHSMVNLPVQSTTTLTVLWSFMIPFSHVTSCSVLPVSLAFNSWLSQLFNPSNGTRKPEDEYEAVLMWAWYLVSYRHSWHSRASARTSFYWCKRWWEKPENY